MHYFSIDCISICYICIVAFKTLHKPYISERMLLLFFLLNLSRYPLFANFLCFLILNGAMNTKYDKKAFKSTCLFYILSRK